MKNLTEQEIRNELTRCGLKQLDGTSRFTLDGKLVFEATESVKILFHVVHQSYSGNLSIEFYPKENFMESVALLLLKHIPVVLLDKPRFFSPGWVKFLLKNHFEFYHKYQELMDSENRLLKIKNVTSTMRYEKEDQTCDQILLVEFLETNMNKPISLACESNCKISTFPFAFYLTYNVTLYFLKEPPMKTFDDLVLKMEKVREQVLKSASKINFS